MPAERWQKVERLYRAALERRQDERLAFVAAECGDDDELRREVESLLAGPGSAATLIRDPSAIGAAKTIDRGSASNLTGARIGVNYTGASVARSYDVNADGSRFIFVREVYPPSESSPREMHLIENWFTELVQDLAGTGGR